MASAVKTAQLAILAQIDTEWNDATEIAWPNVEFTPPDGEIWLQVDILWGDGFVETMEPTGRNRLYGLVQLTLSGPLGEAQGALMTQVDTARDMLNRWTGSGVEFRAASPPVPLADEEWNKVVISVPFDVSETT